MTNTNENNTNIEEPFQQLDMKFADTEAGNRDRFVALNKGKCIYVTDIKRWTIWDGMRWRITDIAPIMKLADEAAKSIFNEARDCQNSEGMRRLTSWAYRSQSQQRLGAMASMAAKWPEMTAELKEFDQDPDLLNCLNGVVHLPTGELLGHHPSQKIMKLVRVEYQPHARCPVFDKFIKEIFMNDNELIAWVQLALGYQLTGHTSEQAFFAAYGTGSNGKSTLYEAINDIMGDYSIAMQFETVLAGDKSNTRTLEAIGNLRGIRMATASEVDSNKKLSEAIIKQLTGGDTLTGASLYAGTYQFSPTHKINLLANHMPYTKDASHGMARRIKIIPFMRRFGSEERDITLPSKLRGEYKGVLAWLIRGSRRWFSKVEASNGQPALGSCHAVDEATQSYITDNDTFGAFLNDCTVKDAEAMSNAGDLYASYQDWSRENGKQYQMGTGIFSARLQERGFQKKRTSSGNVYLGLSLNPEAAGDF